jgi:Holliday junction resolvase RusA-like endonuclease
MEFEFPGQPVPKSRPRFTVVKGRVRTYPDPKQYKNEEDLRKLTRNQMAKRGDKLIGQHVPIRMTAIFNVEKRATSTPDIVNLISQICDALQGECLYNDSQVVELHVYKGHSQEPGSIVSVEVTE